MNILFKLVFILITTQVQVSYGFVEGLYCGKENCYDVLGVSRDVSLGVLKRAYRKLAIKYHPDRNKDPDAVEKFQLIATAYEILKDEDQRRDYDYMLDNPEEAYYHYYRYYKHRMTPKVDVRIVLAVSITVISVLQYLHKIHRYDEAVKYAMQNPRFRNQALQIIHQEGLLENNKSKSKNKKSKEERKKEEERVLKEIVENSIDIKGGYSKPTYQDLLWVQLLLAPYYILSYNVWLTRWIFKFTVMKQEYGLEEKEYLTYKNLNLSAQYWLALDDYSKDSYMNKELWIPEKYKQYKQELEEEYRIKMAENSKHKMWRRYMKKGGPGQMTFAED